MPSWVPGPWTIHLALLLGVGASLALGPGLSSRVRSFRGAGYAAALAVLCVLLGIDAWSRHLPLPFRVFPWVFLGLLALFAAATARSVHLGVGILLACLRAPKIQFACFMTALAGLLSWLVAQPLASEEVWGTPSEEVMLWDKIDRFQEVSPSPFRTDRNRPVRVMAHRSDENPLLEESIRLLQQTLLAKWGLQHRIIALPREWMPCNCHGYVFTGGKYLVPNEEVDAILQDNQYLPVKRPRLGDVVVYRSKNGEVVHSGIVRGLGDGAIFVESKWGKLGRFLHAHDAWIQNDVSSTFYHSARHGHALLSAPSFASNDVE